MIKDGRRIGAEPIGRGGRAAVGVRGRGHLITGFRNRDVRQCLYGERSKDAVVHRRQSGRVSRLLAHAATD